MKELDWECKLNYIAGDPILPSVRNKFVADFMVSGCTHIFFIDDDVSWEPKGFINMVRAGKQVISGIVPIRQADGYAVSESGREKDGLIELDAIGAAFLCIERSAIEEMIKAYPEKRCYTYDSYGQYGYSFFDYEMLNGHLQGEDINFCHLWRRIGKIWGYPDINFLHKSIKIIEGNYGKSRADSSE
jgi:hypothetical protein